MRRKAILSADMEARRSLLVSLDRCLYKDNRMIEHSSVKIKTINKNVKPLRLVLKISIFRNKLFQ